MSREAGVEGAKFRPSEAARPPKRSRAVAETSSRKRPNRRAAGCGRDSVAADAGRVPGRATFRWGGNSCYLFIEY
jgi:hypothetical protein